MGPGLPVRRMTPAALPLCPFPPVHWWEVAAQGATIDLYERWVKGSARNRCLLADASGSFFLTIPVLHPGHAAVADVRISGHVPAEKLWRTVASAYGSAPFFDQIEAELRPIWHDRLREGAALGDAAFAFLRWTSGWIGIAVPPVSENPLPHPWDGLDLRGRSALETPSPPARSYPRIFMDRVPFPQGLSVLDALFHLGPAVGDVLSHHGATHDPTRTDPPAR